MDCCYICGSELAWMDNDTDGYCEWCRSMRRAAPSQDLIRRSCEAIQRTWSPELELCHRTGSRVPVGLTVPVAERVTDHMVRRDRSDS
jgi:hypothetical protein